MDEQDHTQLAVLTERIERLSTQVIELERKNDIGVGRTNSILGGVVVACILMVINVIIDVLKAV